LHSFGVFAEFCQPLTQRLLIATLQFALECQSGAMLSEAVVRFSVYSGRE